jgi:transcriptional regulator with XRE-family HTH domain
MNSEFGKLLQKCRKDADLTQKELGEKIIRDASMISRFEAGTLPNPATLQDIVSELSLYSSVDRQMLDRLWEVAYNRNLTFPRFGGQVVKQK